MEKNKEAIRKQRDVALQWIKDFNYYWTTIVTRNGGEGGSRAITAEIKQWQKEALNAIEEAGK